MTTPAQLDTIYTTDEAAARLRISRRKLIKLGREFGVCSRSGTDYLFSEEDLLKLWSAIRVRPTEKMFTTPSTAPTPWYQEDMTWIFSRPSTTVDRRVLSVLRLLDRQREPKCHKEMKGAGEATIRHMLEKGVVDACGVNSEGLTLVKVSSNGKDQLKIAERWARKREAKGKNAIWWSR
ncbi:helix-turn-helix domain-containing protein [Neorhizobium galegae]|uniref:Helix-turn-helix domain-containing protein n=1 Tax=Neorhizobium galegae TaxID=399 RepID=A0A6A1TUE0_NEOGA|nr:helix-turn-helix domain-containing protein [Neorhizobium galegae]KAB1086517.1 helix-turn-helix domain-containing protein [Neorhizobium galegae]